MAKVSPFKGWRNNPDIIDRIEDVFVPPYDVITSEEARFWKFISKNVYLNQRRVELSYYSLQKDLSIC